MSSGYLWVPRITPGGTSTVFRVRDAGGTRKSEPPGGGCRECGKMPPGVPAGGDHDCRRAVDDRVRDGEPLDQRRRDRAPARSAPRRRRRLLLHRDVPRHRRRADRRPPRDALSRPAHQRLRRSRARAGRQDRGRSGQGRADDLGPGDAQRVSGHQSPHEAPRGDPLGGSMAQRRVWLVRHGETEWSKSGQHTGRTDIALTPRGEQQAKALGRHLAGRQFALVLTSPLARARQTCRLASFDNVAEVSDDLLEWNYGIYEGRTTAAVRAEQPGWSIWTTTVPEGETVEQVGERARRVIERVASVPGDVALFAHAHFLRIFA